MSKVYLDIPNNFLVSSYRDYDEVKKVYKSIIKASLIAGAKVVLSKASMHLHNKAHHPNLGGGVYYAYHSLVSDANTYCLKGSAIPDLWYFDSSGYSGWSSIANSMKIQEKSTDYDISKADAVIQKYKQSFLNLGVSRLTQSTDDLDASISELDGFIFYPLQLSSDLVMSFAKYGQVEVIQELKRLTEEVRCNVVIKRHPLCTSEVFDQLLPELENHPRIKVSTASVHKLIQASDGVLVSNSGVGLQALIHGKPVYSLAKSEYSHLTSNILTLADLPLIFSHISTGQSEKMRSQLGYLLDIYFVDINDERKIKDRLNTHFEACDTSDWGDNRIRSSHLSILHAAKKELIETIEMLLMDYSRLEGEKKKKVLKILIRALKQGVEVDKIIRKTDLELLRIAIPQLIKSDSAIVIKAVASHLLKQKIDCSETHLLLSKIFFFLGNEKDAYTEARLAIEMNDCSADALVFLGRKLAGKVESRDEAFRLAEEALKKDGEHAMANWLLARLHYVKGDLDSAFAASSKAFLVSPNIVSIEALHKKIIDSIE